MALTGNHHYGVHNTILTVSPDCSLQGFRLICANFSPSNVDVQIHRSSYPQLHNLAMICSTPTNEFLFFSHSPPLPTPAFPHASLPSLIFAVSILCRFSDRSLSSLSSHIATPHVNVNLFRRLRNPPFCPSRPRFSHACVCCMKPACLSGFMFLNLICWIPYSQNTALYTFIGNLALVI